MYITLRDLSYMADHFDSTSQYKVADVMDSVSKSLLYNELSYEENVKTASINDYDNQKEGKLLDIVELAEKLSNIESSISSTENNKIKILYSCVCLDVVKMFKDASFGVEKQAGKIGNFFKDLGGFMGAAFRNWTGWDYRVPAMSGKLLGLRKKIESILVFIESFRVRAGELGMNSLAIAQLEDKFIKRLIPITQYLTNIYTSSIKSQDMISATLSKGALDAIRTLINDLPAQKDSQYASQLEGPLGAFVEGIKGSISETSRAASMYNNTMGRQQGSFGSFDMEKFLRSARIAKSRAEKFVETNGSRAIQLLNYLGIDAEWYQSNLIDPKSVWPQAWGWKTNEAEMRKGIFKERLQKLIESSPENIWEDLKQLGMTPRGSWREEGFLRGLQQKNV